MPGVGAGGHGVLRVPRHSAESEARAWWGQGECMEAGDRDVDCSGLWAMTGCQGLAVVLDKSLCLCVEGIWAGDPGGARTVIMAIGHEVLESKDA